jgi:KUP system potassium uptake protein
MSAPPVPTVSSHTARGDRTATDSLPALALGALGVVFGDIGTSPLYTLKAVLGLAGGRADPAIALGVLSLVFWTLTIVTTIKYVSFAMRVDNDGEGGILALMALLGVKRHQRPLIVAAGLFGAALIYGDGAITPAISVLSAAEGLQIATPALQRYVLPISVTILIGLFAIQPLGTAKIGRAFGPVMMLWFFVIGALGVWGIAQHPAVLWAIDPRYGLRFLLSSGATGFFLLGGVFLCVTGAEALYADMGHFGARPIRLAWSALVFPSLVLNYAGQTALILQGAPVSENVFYRLCPPALLVPLVLLATIATVIASQSIITGAFSMTRQAIRLGWLPRLRISQTSPQGYGQIYVGAVNWFLAAATIGITLAFGKSDNLAAAYGIAVSGTMLITSVLLFVAMRDIWHWSLPAAATVSGLFLLVDASFFAANLAKVGDGGYVPLVLALIVYGVMVVWHVGAAAVARGAQDFVMPVPEFMAQLEQDRVARVPGTGVFLTDTERDVPHGVVWHVKHIRSLHEHVVVLLVRTESIPWVRQDERVKMEQMAPDIWRISASFGFMERPDLPALLQQAHAGGCSVDLSDVVYYVGHAIVVHREGHRRLPWIVVALFAMMQRNSAHETDFFRLPRDQVVEIGREIAI